MDYKAELGKAIREARKQKRMTVQDLHHETRLAYHAITRIEQGTTYARLDTLLRICQVLQVKPSTLFAVVDKKL